MRHLLTLIWRKRKVTSILILLIVIGIAIVFLRVRTSSTKIAPAPPPTVKGDVKVQKPVTKPTKPLSSKKFYVDSSRNIVKLAQKYREMGNDADAQLIDRIATQPGTTWLHGPTPGDEKAARDIAEVVRTSTEASRQGTVPLYQLYAIPNRDACAGYSKNGFATSQEYLKWLDEIIASLKSEAVFSVEADAIAQTLNNNCMNQQQISERYQLLQTVMTRLRDSRLVLGSYIDAGHPEWFPEPTVLIEPLRKSGIDIASGVALNVSYTVETAEITKWSQKLVELIGGNKGVIIDTSRNGKGAPDQSVKGEARWCNASGRAIGPAPSTNVPIAHIDAYFWGKIAGESDGSCFGSPPAGVFVPEAALELARNATN